MTDTDSHELKKTLQNLPEAAQIALRTHGFSPEWLAQQAALTKRGSRSNQVSGKVEPITGDDLFDLPEKDSPRWKELSERGTDALRAGECALAVLAGGMATRMGGVIKALVPAAHGKTFLELRLAEQEALARRYGRRPPLWLMTSHATHEGIASALGPLTDESQVGLFRQGLSVRLDERGSVFQTEHGEPSLHAPGHGDFADCLKRSGLLEQFVDQGGKYVLATNLDNLGGGLDPVLVGMHLESECAVTCEVVDKNEGDRGGIPARLEGRPVILEEFRLPSDFDPRVVSVFNVNTFAFDADRLLELDIDWTYFEVTKTVEGKSAIQYERLINEVTFHLATQYIRVPRSGTESRFMPIKDHDELARRQADLNALVAARGMITQE